ncbi:MAG TPA: hypothetical protein VK249_19815, partial [Anaerolineales bacterium]|nr:hypothetical protein [Anaerolineales bacterium]
YRRLPVWYGILENRFFVMPPSSLEDRVRLLCNQAIAAKTQVELDSVLSELRVAIRDHISYVRAMVAETIPEAFGKPTN